MFHLTNDPLPTHKLQRKLTVFLEAPPGDGLRSAREHFNEYVKPVLSAASLDYEVVEGRRQGEIRAGLAEQIRRKRRRAGETGAVPEQQEEHIDLESALASNREKTGVEQWDGIGGDLVVGRHAWKEYIRGLHEGWLGPLDNPQDDQRAESVPAADSQPQKQIDAPLTPDADALTTLGSDALSTTADDQHDSSDLSPASTEGKNAGNGQEERKEHELPSKPLVNPPRNTPSSYPTSHLASSTPAELTPSVAIAFPHLLGFLKTPIRMWRFLNRRYEADAIGRQTAAAVLATHRPFRENEPSVSTSSFNPDLVDGHNVHVTNDSLANRWEQQELLRHEEPDWPKSIRKRPDGEKARELEWLDPMVLDERIAARMRLFEVDSENEERADRIGKGAKGIPGRIHEPRSDYEG